MRSVTDQSNAPLISVVVSLRAAPSVRDSTWKEVCVRAAAHRDPLVPGQRPACTRGASAVSVHTVPQGAQPNTNDGIQGTSPPLQQVNPETS